MLEANGTETVRIELPSHARTALSVLEEAGFEAWCVGGFVRDALIGRPASDVDVATNATWEQARDAFAARGISVIETGVQHGTVTARIDHESVEVTTYRADGAYEDGRHPASVTFVRTIEEDLARRDFTMNALAYHPTRGLCDPFGGRVDIASRTIRAVGDPDERFREDALRVLRAARFAAQLGFSVEEATEAAMERQAGCMRALSGERIGHEMDGLLCGAHPHDAIVRYVDVLGAVIPELLPMKGLDQRNPYHVHDVLEHTAWAVERSPATLLARWAAFLHDFGKPSSFTVGEDGIGHFYGHPARSVELGRAVLKRLRKGTRLAHDVLRLVEYHDAEVADTPKAVKRALRRMDDRPELLFALCDLKQADAAAQSALAAEKLRRAERVRTTLRTVLEERQAFTLRDLAINGNDVIALGIPAGPEVGRALSAALDAVVDERVANRETDLRAYVAKFFEKSS